MIGLAVGLLGVIPPGLLNLTAAKISIRRGMRKAVLFSLGASMVVIVQVYIGVFFSKLINEHPFVLKSLENIAIVLFLGLSIFFFIRARMDSQPAVKPDAKSDLRLFSSGVMLSALNVFPVPFYIALSTWLGARGLFDFGFPHAYLFTAGAVIGTFAMLYVYLRYVRLFKFDSTTFARKIHYTLAALTLIVAVIAAVNKI